MTWYWWIAVLWTAVLVVGVAWIIYSACVAWYEGGWRRRLP